MCKRLDEMLASVQATAGGPQGRQTSINASLSRSERRCGLATIAALSVGQRARYEVDDKVAAPDINSNHEALPPAPVSARGATMLP